MKLRRSTSPEQLCASQCRGSRSVRLSPPANLSGLASRQPGLHRLARNGLLLRYLPLALLGLALGCALQPQAAPPHRAAISAAGAGLGFCGRIREAGGLS